MAINVFGRGLYFKSGIDNSQLKRDRKEASGEIDKLTQDAGQSGNKMASILKKAFAVVAGSIIVKKLIDLGRSLFQIASDAEEVGSKFDVTFQGIEDKAEQTSKALQKSFGYSSLEAERLLSTTGDLLTGFGFMREEALGLSDTTQRLASDLASFNNLQGGAARASRIITKALLGERESLIELGVKVLDADVEQRILEKGMKNLTGQALLQAKAMATLDLIMEQSKNAIGDFARTSESAANQQRILEENIKNLKVSLGDKLLPTVTKGISTLNDVVKNLNESLESSEQKFKNAAGNVEYLDETVTPLITRYRELEEKTDLSNIEQAEMETIISQISEAIPSAITLFNNYGNAIKISADKAEEFIERQQQILKWLNREAIEDAVNSLEKYRRTHEKLAKELEYMTGVVGERGPAPSWRTATGYINESEVIQTLQKEMAVVQENIDSVTKALQYLRGEWDGFDEDRKDSKTEDIIVKIPVDDLKKELDEARKGYEDYEKLIQAGMQESADFHYQSLLQQGNNWREYLRNQFIAYKDNVDARRILLLEYIALEKEITDEVQEYIIESLKESQKEIDNLIEKWIDEAIDIKIDPADIIDVKNVEKLLLVFGKIVEAKDVEKFGGDMRDLADVMGSMANLAGNFSEELAEAAATTANIAMEAANLATAIATQNPLQIIASVINIISNGIKLFKGETKDIESYYQRLTNSITATNNALQRQIDLLDELRGTEWTEGVVKAMNNLNSQVEINLALLHQINIGSTRLRDNTGATTWGIEDFERVLEQTPEIFGSSLKYVQALVDGIREAEESIKDIQDEYEQYLTGTTTENIASSIADGFEEGLDAAGVFAETFEDMMKKSLVNALKTSLYEKGLQDWYSEFVAAVESDMVLTGEEITGLRDSYMKILDQASDAWSQLSEILGEGEIFPGEEEKAGIQGAIQGITEDTAGVLAGQMGAIRINVAEHLDIAQESLAHLERISRNTEYNRYLRAIADSMQKMEKSYNTLAG